MTKVSIIVPVYNVEHYLEKCLKSLINQTLKDIEIIVVNDGTKDNSQKIIDKYSKIDSRIKAYKKENGGLSSARNYGIKKATGDYIAFVDSDDYVELDMYEKMYNKAITKDFDLVVCNINYVYDNKTVNAYSNISKDLFQDNDIKKSMLNIYPSAWNKLYNKRLFTHGIYFKENVWFEDVEFIYRLFPYIKSIGTTHDYLYNYVQRSGAITSTFDKRLYNYIDNWNGIIDYYKENDLFNSYKKYLEYSYVRYIFATFMSRATKLSKDEYNEAYLLAKKNVKNNFPNYRKNILFYKSVKGIYLVLYNKLVANVLYKIDRR